MLVNIHESCVKNISRKINQNKNNKKGVIYFSEASMFSLKDEKRQNLVKYSLPKPLVISDIFKEEGKGNILLSSILPTQNLRSVFVKLHSRVMFHANLINSFLFDCLPSILSIVFINVKPLTQYTKTFLSQYCECNIL